MLTSFLLHSVPFIVVYVVCQLYVYLMNNDDAELLLWNVLTAVISK